MKIGGADPLFILCSARPGPALMLLVLDAHPDLACTKDRAGVCRRAFRCRTWSPMRRPAGGTPYPLNIPDGGIGGAPGGITPVH
jgi:hypothetical protein